MSGHRLGRQSQLGNMIERACDSFRPAPDLALNLEVTDHINSKKANTPREAAVEILRHVNGRNPHSSMLALNLLDICVKNCGYPFHLQISTKEFLNELVRRFPERPPPLSPPPMAKILELINEWKGTICVTSKHRDDLVHIRDMHRLLSYKGYRFPDYDRRAASVLNPQESLRSADELEEEDRAAQAAKLQELIRRGGPKDLAAAQELMKIMAGAEPERKTDYSKQSQKDLATIRQRVLMLNEMLNNAKPQERFVEGDAYDQIAQRCRQVRGKLQKLITELDEEDSEQADQLLELNDLVNSVLNRYDSFVKGDRTAVADVSVTRAGGKQKAPETSLIDFDDPAAPAESASDGLAGLQLGPSSTSAAASATQSNTALPVDLFGPFSGSSSEPTTFNGSNGGLGSIQLGVHPYPTTPGASPPPPMNAAASQRPMGGPMVSNANRPPPAGKAKDPFGDLLNLMD